jgi:RNA polymerase sigma factor (sigma-70 family)
MLWTEDRVTASFQPRALLGATLDEKAGRPESGAAQSDVLRAAAAGEPWATVALYDALYPYVAAALQKILHQTPDYDDLVQATFEHIVRSLRRPRPHPIENLGAWSSAIAARVALSSLRVRVRERRIFARETEAQDVPGPEPERQLDVRRQLRWLQESLAAMRPEHAEAVLLHDVLGYDLAELARIMDVSVSAAQKRLSRGHIELRRRAERRARGSGERGLGR